MGHSHNHTHTHDLGDGSERRIFLTIILNFIITAIQIVGGLLSNSLALISDALHNLSDGIAVLLTYIAMKVSKRARTKSKTFGFKRIEILAALFNAVVLIGISLFLIVEAIDRFKQPTEVKGALMFWMGLVGLLANGYSVFLLRKDKSKNLNIKAAYLHLLGDAMTSIAVIAGAAAIYWFNWIWIDPMITIIVSIYLVVHSWGLLKETLEIIMQFAPSNIRLDTLKAEIESQKHVDNLHHVHVWRLTDKEIHFEGHIEVKEDVSLSRLNPIREDIEELLHHKYGITHCTIQFEYNSGHKDTLLG